MAQIQERVAKSQEPGTSGYYAPADLFTLSAATFLSTAYNAYVAVQVHGSLT